MFIYDADYSETPDPAFQGDLLSDPVPVMYWLTVNRRGSDVPFSPNASGNSFSGMGPPDRPPRGETFARYYSAAINPGLIKIE